MAATKSRVLSQTDVRINSAPVRVGDDRPTDHAHAEEGAGVSVQRDANGDVIEIHVRCACGEVTVINCGYEG